MVTEATTTVHKGRHENLILFIKVCFFNKQGIFRTNKGNLESTKRTKKLNFKEFLVDSWPKSLEAITMVTAE